MTTDPFLQAETYARKLSGQKSGFEYLTPADRGMMLVLMSKIDALTRRVHYLESKLGGRAAE